MRSPHTCPMNRGKDIPISWMTVLSGGLFVLTQRRRVESRPRQGDGKVNKGKLLSLPRSSLTT